MDARLRAAAQAGDPNELYNCIRDDADVLRRIDEAEFVDSPLHIAAARGHSDFVMAIIYLKPSLAQKLNQDIFSPMHLALQNDHQETVLRLLAVEKDLVRVKGKEGFTPLHLVAREGTLDLLAQFLDACPACIEDVTIRNETAFHIASQHDRFEALKFLARWIERTHLYGKISRKHILNWKDGDNNTVLHIAAANTQPQMMRVLLECDVDTKETNMSGLTALDILESKSTSDNRDKSLTILHEFDENCLNLLKAFLDPRDGPLYQRLRSRVKSLERGKMEMVGSNLSMSADRINALLVVLALILTATYQAIINPPGGVWQGDLSANLTDAYMIEVGRSVMDVPSFNAFFILNILVFGFTSFFTIGLLQIATGSVITFLIEILLSFLISSLFVVDDMIGAVPIGPLNSLAAIATKYQLTFFSRVGDLAPLYSFYPLILLALDISRHLPRVINRVKLFGRFYLEM